jgi:hypothetical protein
MIWASGAGAIVLITVILALAFRLSSRTKALGRALERIQNLETGNSWLRAAVRMQSDADPTLDDLDGMYDDDTKAT